MKALYYFTKLLSLPFLIIATVLLGLGFAFSYAGSLIHDWAEVPVWKRLHKRQLSQLPHNL